MWELDCEEGWAPKNWCVWTVLLEKTLESPLDCKEIQPVHSEGDQPWDFFGRNDAKAETLVLWSPHAQSWLIGKDFDAGRDWGQEEKGMTEDEMAGWHHRLDGRESEWTLGVGDGQGSLVCYDSWGRKESDTTERLNWTELNWTVQMVKSIKNNKRMIISKELYRTSLVVQWLRLHTHNAGSLGSSPGQGTRSHMPQLNIPHAATKIWGSQINKYIFRNSVTVTSARVGKRHVQRGADKELLRYGSFLFFSLGGGYFIVILNMYSYMLFCAFLFYMTQYLKQKKQIFTWVNSVCFYLFMQICFKTHSY